MIGIIDEIRIEGEEDGWHLVIYLDDAPMGQTEKIRYRIGLPDQFRAEVDRTIGAWLAEGEAARVSIDLTGENWTAIGQGDGPWTHVSVEYDPEDPKSEGYHDTMSGLYDNREGK